MVWILLLQLGRRMQMWQMLNDADKDVMKVCNPFLWPWQLVGMPSRCEIMQKSLQSQWVWWDLHGTKTHHVRSLTLIPQLSRRQVALHWMWMVCHWHGGFFSWGPTWQTWQPHTATKLVGDAKSAKFSPPKFQNLLRQESWISVDNLLDRSLEYRHRGAAGVATPWFGYH